MGDDDAGHALLFKLYHQIKQLLRICLVERRRRFVKNQQPDIFCQRLGNLDKLLLANADILNQRAGGFLQADPSAAAHPLCCRLSSQSTRIFLPRSLPRNMFSPIVRYGTSASS